MDCEFFIVSSVTYAIKGKAELENHGIAGKVEKIKKVAALGGCGYGIKVFGDEIPNARRYLTLAGIPIVATEKCEGLAQ